MTPDLLRRIGEALHGEHWQAPLARRLGVAERSMRYWLAGREIPEGVRDELVVLLLDKACACVDLSGAIGGTSHERVDFSVVPDLE
jgi:hypothetical protein